MKDLEREKLYISGVIQNTRFLETAPVMPAELYDPGHQEILSAVYKLSAQSGDVSHMSIRDELQARKKLTSKLDDQLMDITGRLEMHPARHQQRLRDLAHARKIHNQALSLTKASEDLDFGKVSALINRMSNTTRTSDKKRYKLKEICIEAWEQVVSEIDAPRLRLGVPALDNAVGAVSSGSMVILGARPNVGKSSMIMSMAMSMARRGKHCSIISVEDPKDLWGQKVIGELSGVNPQKMRNAELSKSDWRDIADVIGKIDDLPITYSDEVGGTVDDVLEAMTYHVKIDGAECLFIDYLNRIKGDNSNGPRIMYTDIAAAIKARAHQLKVPVILACQLKRNEKGDFVKPPISDLKETGALEEMAEVIVMMWKDNAEMTGANAYVAKLKWGPAGKEFEMARNGKGALVERALAHHRDF